MTASNSAWKMSSDRGGSPVEATGPVASLASPRRLELGEPDADFALGGLVGVGAVDHVEGHLEAEVAADRARSGLDRVRGADELPGSGNRLVALEHRGDQRAAGDELDELAEERLLGVLGVVLVRGRLVGL